MSEIESGSEAEKAAKKTKHDSSGAESSPWAKSPKPTEAETNVGDAASRPSTTKKDKPQDAKTSSPKPSASKSKKRTLKSRMRFGATIIVAVSVVAAGGYFYLTNPEIRTLVQSTFSPTQPQENPRADTPKQATRNTSARSSTATRSRNPKSESTAPVARKNTTPSNIRSIPSNPASTTPSSNTQQNNVEKPAAAAAAPELPQKQIEFYRNVARALQETRAEVGSVKQSLESLNQQVDDVASQITRSNRQLRQISNSNRPMVAYMALLEIERAAHNGKPFSRQLTVLINTIPEGNNQVTNALLDLKQAAREGLVRPNALMRQFDDMRSTAVNSATATASTSGMWQWITSWVTVENLDQGDIMTRDGAFNTIEKHLIDGEYTAIGEIAKELPVEVRRILKPWLANIDSYARLESALTLASDALARDAIASQ